MLQLGDKGNIGAEIIRMGLGGCHKQRSFFVGFTGSQKQNHHV